MTYTKEKVTRAQALEELISLYREEADLLERNETGYADALDNGGLMLRLEDVFGVECWIVPDGEEDKDE